MQRSLHDAVERAYERARGTWTGCDWPTSFGQTGLDLNGMTSHQALLMSRATAGEEAGDWREAVQWLRLIETDAEAAEEAARWGVELSARGDLGGAQREAQTACDLEARYHPLPVWSDLREVLQSASPPSSAPSYPAFLPAPRH
jgi:hypothetical protein